MVQYQCEWHGVALLSAIHEDGPFQGIAIWGGLALKARR